MSCVCQFSARLQNGGHSHADFGARAPSTQTDEIARVAEGSGLLNGIPPLCQLRFPQQIQLFQQLLGLNELAGVGFGDALSARRRDNRRDSSLPVAREHTGRFVISRSPVQVWSPAPEFLRKDRHREVANCLVRPAVDGWRTERAVRNLSRGGAAVGSRSLHSHSCSSCLSKV
jgi:hypothetical protein